MYHGTRIASTGSSFQTTSTNAMKMSKIWLNIHWDWLHTKILSSKPMIGSPCKPVIWGFMWFRSGKLFSTADITDKCIRLMFTIMVSGRLNGYNLSHSWQGAVCLYKLQIWYLCNMRACHDSALNIIFLQRGGILRSSVEGNNSFDKCLI